MDVFANDCTHHDIFPAIIPRTLLTRRPPNKVDLPHLRSFCPGRPALHAIPFSLPKRPETQIRGESRIPALRVVSPPDDDGDDNEETDDKKAWDERRDVRRAVRHPA